MTEEKRGRRAYYQTKIEGVQGKEDAFVIFTNQKSGKLMRFSSEKGGKKVRVDIPVRQLSDDEAAKLVSLGFREGFGDEVKALANLPSVGRKRARAILRCLGSLKDVSKASEEELQKVPGVGVEIAENVAESKTMLRQLMSDAKSAKNYSLRKICALTEAVGLTDRFFRKVCLLPEDYEVEVESHRGIEKCDFCGGTVRGVIEPPEISIEKARELGVEESRIQELVEKRVHFTRKTLPQEPKWVIDALCSAIRRYGPVFPAVCSECAKRLKEREEDIAS